MLIKNKLILLCLLISYISAQKQFTMATIKQLGENCFDAINKGADTEDVKLEPTVTDKQGNANAI